MRKLILIFAVILFYNALLVNSFSGSNWIITDLDIKGGFELIPESSSYSIKEVIVNTSFFPKDFKNQEILSQDSSPKSYSYKDYRIFKWEEPKENKNSFLIGSKVRTYNKITRVKKKIRFPIKSLDDELERYLLPAETIDSDDNDIIKLASQLVKGEDDLYEAVFKLAKWTEDNIEYDLSTLTEGVSQKASWVLLNKQGVCDELTSLFIAMCRSVGIPARFITGLAYTESELFTDNWGAHGWAEVYFPGYGWIPFDVTYNQLGYLDATHIKVRESLDAGTSSTQYQWTGRNIRLKTNKLTTDVKVLEEGSKTEDYIQMKVSPIKKDIGFGSYNVIEVVLKNKENFYVATEIYLSKTEGIEIYGKDRKNVLLLPDEEKKIFWIINVKNNLEKGYIYTFPIVVYSSRNSSAASEFKAESSGIRYSLEEMGELLDNMEEEEIKTYSREVTQECSIDKEKFYTDEQAKVECKIKNTGNDFLEGLDVCLAKECTKIDLGISQSKKINFTIRYNETGKKEETISTKNNLISKFNYINFIVLDKPRIEINRLKFPSKVRFEELFNINFSLEKKSISKPLNVEVILDINTNEKRWEIKEMDNDKVYIVNLYGSSLHEGRNDINLRLRYSDDKKREYYIQKDFNIELVDVTALQKIELLAYKIEKLLRKMNLNDLIVVVFFGAAAFVFIILLVFRLRSKSKDL